jgi:hypothetical protein
MWLRLSSPDASLQGMKAREFEVRSTQEFQGLLIRCYTLRIGLSFITGSKFDMSR